MNSGFIKIHRRLLKWKFADNPEVFALWIHFLLMATHAEHETACGLMSIKLKPGQFVTGRKKLSAAIGISEMKVERIINALISDQQIEQQTFTKYRIISICNWDKYQVSEQQNEQQTNNNRTTTEQQPNTIQEGKRREKKEPLKPTSPGSSFDLPDWIPSESWIAFVDMRKKIKKPITGRAAILAVGMLDNLRKEGNNPGDVLDQSTFNSWQGLFPIKPDFVKKGTTFRSAEQKKNDNTIEAGNRFLERRGIDEEQRRETLPGSNDLDRGGIFQGIDGREPGNILLAIN